MKKYTELQIAIILFIVFSTLSFIVFGFITVLNQSNNGKSILGASEVNYSGTVRKYPTFSLVKVLVPGSRLLQINESSEVVVDSLNLRVISADSKLQIINDEVVMLSGISLLENTSQDETFSFEIENNRINVLPSSIIIINVDNDEFFVLKGIVTASNGQVFERSQKARWVVDSWSIREFDAVKLMNMEYLKDLSFTLWNLDYEI